MASRFRDILPMIWHKNQGDDVDFEGLPWRWVKWHRLIFGSLLTAA